jgi:hypothetical protein
MKTLSSVVSLLAISFCAAGADPKTEVADAIKKLASQPNYSWTSTPKTEGSESARRQGPTDGKTEKDGFSHLKVPVGDVTVEVGLKGEKMVVNYNGDWISTAEVGENNRNVQRLRAMKRPTDEAETLAGKATALKKESDGVYAGDLDGAAAKEMFALLGRRAAEAPEVKGTVKFWIKDGHLAKYEFVVRGKITVGGEEKREVDLSRTTTVEIKEVGTTKVSLPEDATKKLS